MQSMITVGRAVKGHRGCTETDVRSRVFSAVRFSFLLAKVVQTPAPPSTPRGRACSVGL
jgi:hypothetical protein